MHCSLSRMPGVSGNVKGVLSLDQSWTDDATKSGKNPYAIFGDGIAGPTSCVLSKALVWEGINEDVFQFQVKTDAQNFLQSHWNSLSTGDDAGGSCGTAAGILEISLPFNKYLVIPKRAFVAFEPSKNTLDFYITCEKPRIGNPE